MHHRNTETGRREDWPSARPGTTAILNGFGRTLGDSIVGLQALETAIRLGPDLGTPALYRLPGLPSITEELYQFAEFAEIRELPWSHSTRDTAFDLLSPADRVIDIRDFAFDTSFLRSSMIDYFLCRLGLDPDKVPAGMKRNGWLAPRVTLTRQKFPDGYILICPTSINAMRSMPDEIHKVILSHLQGQGDLITQGVTPAELEGRVVSKPEEESLEDLCTLISRARWVVSTDTATVHLADAFDVPCLAFFPTHDPAWRVRDYPFCTAVPLAGAEPSGLEFARTESDLLAACRAWFPFGQDLSWLERILGEECRRVVRQTVNQTEHRENAVATSARDPGTFSAP